MKRLAPSSRGVNEGHKNAIHDSFVVVFLNSQNDLERDVAPW